MMLYMVIIMINMTICFLLIMMSQLMMPQSMKAENLSPFECGFDPKSKTRTPFSLRFFSLTILFIIFDVEIMLILPLPMLTQYMIYYLYMTSMMIFMFLLLIGLLHEWNESKLKWIN